MTDFRFRHFVDVQFRDCDPMRHVNHAVYFTYMEQARFACWHAVTGARPLGDANIILARAECDFRSAATVGDRLEVRVRVSGMGRSSFTMDYEIVDARDGRLLATAKTVQVMYDYSAGRSYPIPADTRAKIEAYEGRTLTG